MPAYRPRPEPAQTWLAHDWPHLLLIFAALATLYLTTAPRTVVLEDDGLFILSAYFLGIEHPPGYPLFVLLGKLATLLPFGSVAWRVHALNGVIAAAACALLYLVASHLRLGRTSAYLAAVGLGVSEAFWSQALIADVYPLHSLIVIGLLALALTVNPVTRDPAANAIGPPPMPIGARTPRGHLDASALLFGLGLANHWPLLLLAAPSLALLWWPNRRAIGSRLPRLALLVLIGLLPYLWMVLRSWQQPVISFQGPLADWTTIVDFVLRRGYVEIDQSDSVRWTDRLAFGGDLLWQIGRQLLLPGALLALLGALGQWRTWGPRIALALTLAFLGPTLGLLFLLGFDYQPMQREAFRVYPLVAWAVLALWAGLGLQLLSERARQYWTGPTCSGPDASAAPVHRFAIAGTASLLALTLFWHWPQNDRRQDWLAHAYGETLLAVPPPNALFLVRGDMPTTTTAYLHLIAGQRPDLQLISEVALVLEPKPFHPRYTPRAQQPVAVDALIAAADRPVFRLHNGDLRSGTNTWLGFHLDPASTAGEAIIDWQLAAPERALLARLAAARPFADGWSELLRRQLLTRFVRFLTQAEQVAHPLGRDPELLAAANAIIDKLPEAALARAVILDAADPDRNATEVTRLLQAFAVAIDDPGLGKRERAAALNLIARQQQRAGNTAGFAAAIAESIAQWPSPDNPAYGTDARCPSSAAK